MRPARAAAAALAALFLLGGCAFVSPPAGVATSPEAWTRALRRLAVDPARVTNPLAYTDEMRETAARICGEGEPLERLERLQQALFDPKRFPFEYDVGGTKTAAEAFRERRGNCLSFTSLFISLARSQGIPVEAGVPLDVHAAESRAGDLLVVDTHIVAALRVAGTVTTYDFDRTRRGIQVGVRLVDDLKLTALYLNNIGVEALQAGRVDEALRELETAAAIQPDLAATYGNLGVARRRAGDLPGAFEAYRSALALTPHDPAILGNLAAFYRSQGREREARSVLALSDLAASAPRFLLVAADLKMAAGGARSALPLYRKARRADRGSPDPWLGIARAEIALGRREAARRAVREALALDPGSDEARRIAEEIGAGR